MLATWSRFGRRIWIGLRIAPRSLLAYVRAYGRAVRWLYESNNKEKVVDILLKYSRQDRKDAEDTYSYFGNHRQAQRRDQCRACRSRIQVPVQRSGRRDICRFASRFRQVHRRLSREMGKDNSRRGRQGRLIRHSVRSSIKDVECVRRFCALLV